MKKSKSIMGMPVVIEISDSNAKQEDFNEVFAYFHYIDKKFSTYIKDSEVSLLNRKEIRISEISDDFKKILKLSEDTKKVTNGYFNIEINGKIDPSGLVKGYAIWEGAKILLKKGYKNFYVEIAGDIQTIGKNKKGNEWMVGIQNPFNPKEIVKVVKVSGEGVATSGNYQRGVHIINPKNNQWANGIASITVIGPNIFEADRFATAAFAMGEKGINFISSLKGFAGYMIKNDGTAVLTKDFKIFLI